MIPHWMACGLPLVPYCGSPQRPTNLPGGRDGDQHRHAALCSATQRAGAGHVETARDLHNSGRDHRLMARRATSVSRVSIPAITPAYVAMRAADHPMNRPAKVMPTRSVTHVSDSARRPIRLFVPNPREGTVGGVTGRGLACGQTLRQSRGRRVRADVRVNTAHHISLVATAAVCAAPHETIDDAPARAET
jgi:hypothetical protein